MEEHEGGVQNGSALVTYVHAKGVFAHTVSRLTLPHIDTYQQG